MIAVKNVFEVTALNLCRMLVITLSSAGLLGGPLTARRPASVARAHLRAVSTSPELPTVERQQKTKDRLHVRIDDEWYDLTNWRMAHPAGAHWIDAYKDSDATEVMYGFHSDKGMGMIKRLPRSKAPPVDTPPPVDSSYAFRELRAKLVADGWYKPHWRGELQKLMPWAATLWIAKTLSMRSGGLAAFGAIFAYAVSNTLSGWLSHDYVHGRSPFCMAMRGFGELVGGMSTTWWSMKHNMHHALTNEIGYDEDVPQHGQSVTKCPLGRVPSRLMCLLRARQAAPGRSALLQGGAQPLGAPPWPQVLERAALKVAHFTGFAFFHWLCFFSLALLRSSRWRSSRRCTCGSPTRRTIRPCASSSTSTGPSPSPCSFSTGGPPLKVTVSAT